MVSSEAGLQSRSPRTADNVLSLASAVQLKWSEVAAEARPVVHVHQRGFAILMRGGNWPGCGRSAPCADLGTAVHPSVVMIFSR
ncbi:hypothetical protein KZ770_26645 [Escherichia coli]|nr:hypothetical protein [Escherichia coli]